MQVSHLTVLTSSFFTAMTMMSIIKMDISGMARNGSLLMKFNRMLLSMEENTNMKKTQSRRQSSNHHLRCLEGEICLVSPSLSWIDFPLLFLTWVY